MTQGLKYDVSLSRSAEDKSVVQSIAKRFRKDGLRVWLDNWEIYLSDNVPARIQKRLESSRVLVLCISPNAPGSDWTKLEHCTFRDPLDRKRRVLPPRFDSTSIKSRLTNSAGANRPDSDMRRRP
jgi:TIR domain